ncbi:helix-turn-helix transcriptional regulator [Adhaeribacter swui]|uniref:Helix-turn-helix transcriptional regulator n=1 Tax=Adhaeribacter swui TaxID=2086471 RepID=A0A7G7G7D6_9BACT|nr:helix-turn-helix transcriptional regulator [Adhaeribacter swui]QNF33070.1 helix-turn-helix transcriptional regulator [Adhaeribacter swui]
MIGENIKKAIEDSDLTPEQVAAHAEMSVANLYKIYKRDSVESRYLVKIAEILRLPVEYLLYNKKVSKNTYYNVKLNGIANTMGHVTKQKITIPGNLNDNSKISMDKVLHELALCRAENASLVKELQLKDEIIELLKKIK